MTKQPTKPRPHGRRTDLALELDRLDALQAPHWARALMGDIEAAEAVLEIVDRKILLLAEDRGGIRD